jgi:membrane protease YdiL (CAAX protease family)
MDSTTAPQTPQSDSPANESTQWNQPAPNSPNPVFYNEQGIRSGWRILFYLCLALLLYGVELVPVSFFLRAQEPYKVSTIILGEAMAFFAAYGAALLMARIEGQPNSVYGLPFQNAFGKRFWQGMLIGICEISLIVGCMTLFRAYSFGPLAFHGLKILEWGVLWLIAAILIALPEEFLFRGYLQFTLADGIGFWPAAFAMSLFFALVHRTNPGENWFGVANIFFTGLLWAFTLRRTGSLWLAVGWHAAFDFGESFLYSVPDSGGIFEGHLSNATVAHGRAWLTGGEVGPEGSLLAFLTLVLGAILIHFLFPAAQTQSRKAEAV